MNFILSTHLLGFFIGRGWVRMPLIAGGELWIHVLGRFFGGRWRMLASIPPSDGRASRGGGRLGAEQLFCGAECVGNLPNARCQIFGGIPCFLFGFCFVVVAVRTVGRLLCGSGVAYRHWHRVVVVAMHRRFFSFFSHFLLPQWRRKESDVTRRKKRKKEEEENPTKKTFYFGQRRILRILLTVCQFD